MGFYRYLRIQLHTVAYFVSILVLEYWKGYWVCKVVLKLDNNLFWVYIYLLYFFQLLFLPSILSTPCCFYLLFFLCTITTLCSYSYYYHPYYSILVSLLFPYSYYYPLMFQSLTILFTPYYFYILSFLL